MRYYQEEGRPDEVTIDLPKGGYAPAFRHREAGTTVKRSITASLLNQNTVAVLPFSDHSAAGDLGYFCNALRHEVIHALATLETLRVLAWDPAEPAHASDPRQAVNTLHAAIVVSGSIRTAGDRLRVITHLIDGASGCYLWSESMDFSTVDFAAQEAVAQIVVKKLQPDALGRRPVARLPADREPRRAQSVPPGALSHESADRRGTPEGRRVLRAGHRGGQPVRARPQRPRRRATGC